MSESEKVVLDPESEKTLVQRIVDAVRKPTPPPKEQTPPAPPAQPVSTELSEDEAAALADAIDQRVEDKLAEKKKPPEGTPPEGKPAEQKPPVETVESLKARLKELEAKPPPPEAPKGQPPADRPEFSDLAEEIAAEIVKDPQAGFSTLFRTMYDKNRKKKA
jgi:hypothetical protein